jgi:ribosomal protein S27AE
MGFLDKLMTATGQKAKEGIDGRKFCPKCGSDHLMKASNIGGKHLKCAKCGSKFLA